jgi:SAM-dependent methyltransferase
MAQPFSFAALETPPAPLFTLRETPDLIPHTTDTDTDIELNEHSRAYAANERQILALVELGRALIDAGYEWICPTPQTQALVNGRFVNRKAHDLRGVFGWNRPATPDVLDALPPALVQSLCEAGVLQLSIDRETVRSRVRFSSFAGTLLAHAAWPTHDPEAVFFGPDTYRFGVFLERELGLASARQWASRPMGARPFTVADVGCGTGAGGILAARLLEDGATGEDPHRVIFTDPNARSLRYTRCNARIAGLDHTRCVQGQGLEAVDEPIDLVLANPPGLMDPQHRGQRHGGGELGTGPTLKVVDEALQRLAPGGRLLLCATAPVVDGMDVLWRALQPLLARAHAERGAVHRYSLIDPDVAGAELAQPEHAEVERVAVMGLSVQLPVLR